MISKELLTKRKKIDEIDDCILELLGQRFQMVSTIGKLKKKIGIDIEHKKREEEILERVLKKGEKMGLNPLLLQSIFLQIFVVSKKNQTNELNR